MSDSVANRSQAEIALEIGAKTYNSVSCLYGRKDAV